MTDHDPSRDRDIPDVEAWRPWSPAEAAALLAGLPAAWCVAGGWAIELWLGRPHRGHGDLEIAITRADFALIRDRLAAYQLYSVGDGQVQPLPADGQPIPKTFQHWVRDQTDDLWRMDVMIEPGDASTWVFRRDQRIQAPRARMVATRDGIPYLRPEGALLYKAKAARAKDEADFDACLPGLSGEARAWLAEALALAHPGHRWIERLAEPGAEL